MSQRESSGSHKSTVLFLTCLAAGFAVGAACFRPDPPPEANTGALTEQTQVRDLSGVTARHRLEPALDRVAVTTSVPRNPTAPITIARPLVFEECVAKLCEMGLRTAELAQEDEVEAAQKLNEEVRELLEQVLEQFADAGERSLGLLVEMSSGPAVAQLPALDNTKLAVLQLLLQAELTRRSQLAEAVEDRSRVDALVQAMLDSMPISSLTAQMGEHCLHQAPHLRLVHEPSVLHLLTLASEKQFPRDIATKLLMTLRDNMLASGERSSDELSQLAMLKLDSSDPSEIIAACRQLLADARYRAVVLSWMRDQKSRELAIDIAALAAKELPVHDALEVLCELSPLLTGTRGTYMTLGIRAPHAVSEAYQNHLAANNHPDVRGELIMGLGMLPHAAGLPVAELALANDPSPDVRIQAMYVFTVHATPEAAEQAVEQLLDDPAIANDSLRLGSIVLALQNLEHGDPNLIARLATRLKSLPLADYSRVALKEILDRCLPGGAPTNGG